MILRQNQTDQKQALRIFFLNHNTEKITLNQSSHLNKEETQGLHNIY